jgi:Flp pilus assembly protein TadD
MFQHSSAAYPAWYAEGLAEVFSTLKLTEDGFALGAPPEGRAGSLIMFNPDLTEYFDPPRYLSVDSVYGGGWLLTSYLSFEPKRADQLKDYLNRLNRGEESIDAARAAFGDLKKLGKEVSAYRTSNIRGLIARFPGYVAPTVELRQLSPAEAAAVPIQIRSRRGVTTKIAPAIAERARKVLADFPDDETVLLMASEAEIDALNLDAGEADANKALALNPKSGRAEIMLARAAMERARNDPAQFAAARGHYLRANRTDPDNAEPLSGYYFTYLFANQTPPEGALIALERAYELAPFDEQVRQGLAYQLLTEKRDREAVAVLGPIVNSPHKSKHRDKFRGIVDKIEAGQHDEALALLRPGMPKHDDKDEEEG